MMFLLGIIINSLFYISKKERERRFSQLKKEKLFIFILNHRQLFLNI